jgi:hypothetical protein
VVRKRSRQVDGVTRAGVFVYLRNLYFVLRERKLALLRSDLAACGDDERGKAVLEVGQEIVDSL